MYKIAYCQICKCYSNPRFRFSALFTLVVVKSLKKTYADIVRICKMLPECHIVCCGTLIYI